MELSHSRTRLHDEPAAPGVSPDPTLGDAIPGGSGRYRKIRPIGEGGMGEVYLAEDTWRSRLVAIKVSRYDTESNHPEGLQRFRREALVAATFNHPGLCPVVDAGVDDGLFYLVMEYVEGVPLSTSIRRRDPLPDGRAAAGLVRKVALAVAEAHAKGIIHRDLKPSNILIRPDGEPVVIDFGLARWSSPGETRLTRTGTVLGTPHYMSPEQVDGDVRAMGPGCDVYSLGVVFYELLTGRLPFEGSLASVLGKILFFDPPPPSSHRPDLDPGLEAICRRAMAKEIRDRFERMADLADALSGPS